MSGDGFPANTSKVCKTEFEKFCRVPIPKEHRNTTCVTLGIRSQQNEVLSESSGKFNTPFSYTLSTMRELVRSQDICGKDLAIKASVSSKTHEMLVLRVHQTKRHKRHKIHPSTSMELPGSIACSPSARQSWTNWRACVQLAAWVPLFCFYAGSMPAVRMVWNSIKSRVS